MSANIYINNFNKLDLRLSNYGYWDFHISYDENHSYGSNSSSGDCLVVWYDFNNQDTFFTGITSANTLNSLVYWTGSTNTGYSLNTIGLTGIDNGLITFDWYSGDTGNTMLLSAITASTLVIPSEDYRLRMDRVTGTTSQYIYPIDLMVDPNSGQYSQLCGGFYQGFFKLDGYSYEVLPIRVNRGWGLEFWLNKNELNCSGYTGTTLNDLYPDNKGIFFYMGTRAENKYWNIFEGLNTGCTSGCTADTGCTDIVTQYCTIPKETDIVLDSGYPLSPPPIVIKEIENKFLSYNRSRSGRCGSCGGVVGPDNYGNLWPNGLLLCCCTNTGQTVSLTSYTQTITDKRNPFLVYSRARGGGCLDSVSGETICSFSGFTSNIYELDYKLDIIDNALAFRIKDDGSIGYRLLTVTGQCIDDTYVTGTTIQEEYSASGMVSDNEWSHIFIRFVTNELDDCQLQYAKPRKGKLMFYVNARLKFVVYDFDEFIARRLNEYRDKQVGVPFNFSLGGGSQGLLESQTFDGQDPRDLNLPIQENFAGTFIGGISQFRYYICNLSWCEIKNIFEKDVTRYRPNDIYYITQDNLDLILQDNGYGITWI